MKWKKKNTDTFYLSKGVDKFTKIISKKDISFLIQQAVKSKENKSRLCLHSNIKSKLHQMIIFHRKNHNVKIHKHLNTDEHYFIIKGKMKVNFYDISGKLIKSLILASNHSNYPFYINVPKNTFHNQEFMYDTIFFEIKNGPFLKKNDIYLK